MTIRRPFLKATCAALAVITATAAAAQEARLVSTDGVTDFTGELVSFDGETYELRTNMGVLRIPANEVQCIGDPCPQVNEVNSSFRIAGAPSILRFVMPEMLDAYSLEVDTDIDRGQAASGDLLFQLLSFEGDVVADVELSEADAATAIGDLADGSASISVTTRPVSDAEARLMAGGDRRAVEQRGLERVIGLDGLIAIVGENVTVETLTRAQLAGILSGRITNWSEVGGDDLPISAFTREDASEVRTMADSLIMGRAGRPIGANVISVDSNDGVVSAVSTFPNSIGIASIAALGDGGRALGIPDACGVPIMPSEFAIKTGTYPLAAPVYIYESPEALSVHARGLVDFAQSTEGQRVMQRTGYVDLLPRSAPEGIAPVDAISDGATQLSTTIDVDAGGGIDTRDQSELGHLAQYIQSGQADGQRVTLVGLAETEDAGTRAAQRVLASLFGSNSDIEENLTISFEVASSTFDDAQVCPAQLDDAAARVQIWVAPLNG